MSFTYDVDATAVKARSGVFHLPHCELRTPIFMPVATQGAMKGVTVEMLEEIDCEIILGNTYHLGLRPGPEILEAHGGVHGLQGWKRNILTDSGGFQMVSLLELSQITEEGVLFRSTHGSDTLMLKPEDSIRIQNAIGGDIMMQLDDCIHVLTTGPRVEEAMERSIRWLDRCLSANANPAKQCVFGIIQGALDEDLRKRCLTAMIDRDCRGYAIGGLSGGESKDEFWRIVHLCTSRLPPNKPRYCMGVGYPVDIVVCIALGVDMFDCVYACRTARFGTALTCRGNLQLTRKTYAKDKGPLCEECQCRVCREHSRAYLHTLAAKTALGGTLLSYHNIHYLVHLTRACKKAIQEGAFEPFVATFMAKYHPAGDYPGWAVDALRAVNIQLPPGAWPGAGRSGP
jgi:tRNA-guanine transglycosylase